MRFINGRLIFGLLLVAVGVIIVLNLLGFDIQLGKVWDYWPVILLILGLNWIVLSFRTRSSGEGKRVFFSLSQFIMGLVAVAVGVIYLGRNFGYFQEFDTRVFWSILLAVVLILAGLSLLRGRSAAGQGRFALLGGANVGGSNPWKLDSGSYFAFMGGIDIDLSAAEVPLGETVLDLTAIMGGIDVKIPPGLSVIYEGTAFLGGVSFKDQEDGGIVANRKVESNLFGESDRVVRIQARALMGGIDIKEK